MLPPLPRRSGWAYCFAHSPSRISLPRKGRRVGLRIVLFEACSAFTRVTACTLAPSPIRDALSEGFSHFVTSIAAPVASGWSGCRVGLAPTGKRRLVTAHTRLGHRVTGFGPNHLWRIEPDRPCAPPYFGAGARIAASAFSRASIFACMAVSCARSAPTLKNTSFSTGASSLAA